jgi:hypothetical protein
MDPAKLHAAGTALVAAIFHIITAATRSPAHKTLSQKSFFPARHDLMLTVAFAP